MLAGMEEVGTGLLDRLDAMQRVAASAPGGPMLIVAGPGTGKTRTLTHRIAYLCAELGVFAEHCLAITFTRRAAEELRHRLDGLLGPVADDVTVATFHSLGLTILRENAAAAGLPQDFRIADDTEREAARKEAGDDDATYREAAARPGPGRPRRADHAAGAAAREDADLVDRYQGRWRWIFVDEYQDVDETQYELLRLLCPADGNLCAIGDPDQAIYSFRGADVGYFMRFAEDFTDARLVRLTRNYRSSAPILAAAVQAIAPSSLVRGGGWTRPGSTRRRRWSAATRRRLGHRRGRLRRPYRRRPGRWPLPPVAGLGPDQRQRRRHLLLRHRRALPHRPAGRARSSRRSPGPASRCRSGRTTGCATAPASRRSPASCGSRVRPAKVTARPGTPCRPTPGRTVRHAHSRTAPAAARARPTSGRPSRCSPRWPGAAATTWSSSSPSSPPAPRSTRWTPRAEAVTLLTLHAAKGLEFPVVFLVGCEDGLLPLRFFDGRTSDDDLAEERRLFFVGLTRAQDRLYVSHAQRRFRHGTERDTGPSPFLGAIDAGPVRAARRDRGTPAEGPTAPPDLTRAAA